MLASRWVIEKLIKHLNDKKYKEMETLFRRYKDDLDLQKVHKDFLVYQHKPTPTRLKDAKKRLDTLYNSRKMESSSGGTRLWFGDRRVKGSRTTR